MRYAALFQLYIGPSIATLPGLRASINALAMCAAAGGGRGGWVCSPRTAPEQHTPQRAQRANMNYLISSEDHA